MLQLNRLIHDYLAIHGVPPSTEHLAAAIHRSVEMTQEIQEMMYDPVSLEMLVGEGEDNELGEFIADSNALQGAAGSVCCGTASVQPMEPKVTPIHDAFRSLWVWISSRTRPNSFRTRIRKESH